MPTDPNSPKVLVTVPNELEAGAIVAALADFGIAATLTGELTAGFRVEAPGEVSVIVKQQDLERAAAALEEIDYGPADVDWSQGDVGEPED